MRKAVSRFRNRWGWTAIRMLGLTFILPGCSLPDNCKDLEQWGIFRDKAVKNTIFIPIGRGKARIMLSRGAGSKLAEELVVGKDPLNILYAYKSEGRFGLPEIRCAGKSPSGNDVEWVDWNDDGRFDIRFEFVGHGGTVSIFAAGAWRKVRKEKRPEGSRGKGFTLQDGTTYDFEPTSGKWVPVSSQEK